MRKVRWWACETVARLLYFCRVQYGVSTGICGGITYGYGKLDDNGYWQFPLYEQDLRRRKS